MLIIHHLGKSQSERIVWLCEELGLSYQLKTYARDPVTVLAPPELKALHPIGAAPLLEDGKVLLAESAAIAEYIMARHDGGRLRPGAEDPSFPDYLYWFHYANGTLQPAMSRSFTMRRLDLPAENPVVQNIALRLRRAFELVEQRLGETEHFAGAAFTAADVMMGFSLTTMRYFTPVDLGPYPNLRAYLRRIGEREAYRRAMGKSDPGMALLLA